jgi:antitoxin HicB
VSKVLLLNAFLESKITQLARIGRPKQEITRLFDLKHDKLMMQIAARALGKELALTML